MTLYQKCEHLFDDHQVFVHKDEFGDLVLCLVIGDVTYELVLTEEGERRYDLFVSPERAVHSAIFADRFVQHHPGITESLAAAVLSKAVPVAPPAGPAWTTWVPDVPRQLTEFMTRAGYTRDVALLDGKVRIDYDTNQPVPASLRDRMRIIRAAIRREADDARYPLANLPNAHIVRPLHDAFPRFLKLRPAGAFPLVEISTGNADVYGRPYYAYALSVLGRDAIGLVTVVFAPPAS